jgi:hypothetical protein
MRSRFDTFSNTTDRMDSFLEPISEEINLIGEGSHSFLTKKREWTIVEIQSVILNDQKYDDRLLDYLSNGQISHSFVLQSTTHQIIHHILIRILNVHLIIMIMIHILFDNLNVAKWHRIMMSSKLDPNHSTCSLSFNNIIHLKHSFKILNCLSSSFCFLLSNIPISSLDGLINSHNYPINSMWSEDNSEWECFSDNIQFTLNLQANSCLFILVQSFLELFLWFSNISTFQHPESKFILLVLRHLESNIYSNHSHRRKLSWHPR